MKNANKKQYPFPPEEELQKVMKRFADPSYQRVNKGLFLNATTEDKIKHNLCKSIIHYARENNLTEKKLGGKLGIDQTKTEYILFGHINKLILGELIAYVDNLHIPLEIKINTQHDQQESSPRTH